MYLKALYKLRAWIDRRVPRDLLIIEVRGHGGHTFARFDHLELLGSIKQGRGFASIGELPQGSTIQFTTEHMR